MHQGSAHEVKLGHMTLRGKLWGNPSARPMLALHGWLDNAASFDFLAPQLPDYFILALDLPGHGLSDHLPEGSHYNLIDTVSTMFQVLDQQGWQQVTLLGHSLGAALCTLMAASLPDRVDHLIVIDALGPLSEEVSNGPERLGNTVSKLISASKRPRRVYDALEDMIQTRIDANGLRYLAAKALVDRGSRRCETGFAWRFDPRLLLPSLLYLTEEQVHAFLEKIQAPTFLVIGDQGLLAGNPMVDARIAKVRDMNHTVISGHHHVHMDASDAVADAIKGELHARLSNRDRS